MTGETQGFYNPTPSTLGTGLGTGLVRNKRILQKNSHTTLGTGLARTGTNTGTPQTKELYHAHSRTHDWPIPPWIVCFLSFFLARTGTTNGTSGDGPRPPPAAIIKEEDRGLGVLEVDILWPRWVARIGVTRSTQVFAQLRSGTARESPTRAPHYVYLYDHPAGDKEVGGWGGASNGQQW